MNIYNRGGEYLYIIPGRRLKLKSTAKRNDQPMKISNIAS